MKRVVFIIPSFTGGGAERVIITFLKYINRNQIEPILIVQNELDRVTMLSKNLSK